MLQVHLANFITHIQQLLNKSSKYSDLWEENLHTPDSLIASAMRHGIAQLLSTAVASLGRDQTRSSGERETQGRKLGEWPSAGRGATECGSPVPALRAGGSGRRGSGGPCQSLGPAAPAPGPPTAQGQRHDRARRPRRPLAGCHVTLRGKQELRGAGGGGGPGRGRRACGGLRGLRSADRLLWGRLPRPGLGRAGDRDGGGLTSNMSPSRKSIARQETMSA